MATLTFQFTSIATGTLTKTYTFSETDANRWLISLGSPGQTNVQVLLNWANTIVAKTIADEQAYEKAQPITPLSLS